MCLFSHKQINDPEDLMLDRASLVHSHLFPQFTVTLGKPGLHGVLYAQGHCHVRAGLGVLVPVKGYCNGTAKKDALYKCAVRIPGGSTYGCDGRASTYF